MMPMNIYSGNVNQALINMLTFSLCTASSVDPLVSVSVNGAVCVTGVLM